VPYQLAYNEDLKIVELTSQADIHSADIEAAVRGIFQLVRDRDCNLVLVDWTQSKLAVTTVGIYELPEVIARTAKSLDVSIHRIKRAILVREKTEEFKFYEDVTRNRGQNVKVFVDRPAAINWLRSTP